MRQLHHTVLSNYNQAKEAPAMRYDTPLLDTEKDVNIPYTTPNNYGGTTTHYNPQPWTSTEAQQWIRQHAALRVSVPRTTPRIQWDYRTHGPFVYSARLETTPHGQYWYAYARINGHLYKKYIGQTDAITRELLAQVGQALQTKSLQTHFE
jgi:hypothetical protein